MIIDANKDTIPLVRNLYLLHHILPGLLLFEDLKAEMTRIGLAVDEYNYDDRLQPRLEYLRKKAVIFRNNDKSIYINRISPSCIACEKGIGEIILDMAPSCQRECYHCLNDVSSIPEGQANDTIAVIDAFASHHEIHSFGLTGGEPLLYRRQAIASLRHVHESFPNAHKRLHTSGDFVDADLLGALREVRLDEIRFSIREADFEDWSRFKEKLLLAKQHIPRVLVETSMIPGTLERMKAILRQLDEIDIFGINLCEYCYCMHHTEEPAKRPYRVRFPPFRIPYFSRMHHTGIPIARSDLESYDLLRFALETGMKIGLHYCSLENRRTSLIYALNHDLRDDPIGVFSERDFYVKSAMACGEEDVIRVLKVLKEKDIEAHRLVDGPVRCLEFPVRLIPLLRGMNIQLGIASAVMEPAGLPVGNLSDRTAAGIGSHPPEKAKRVVKVDFTSPDLFDLDEDI